MLVVCAILLRIVEILRFCSMLREVAAMRVSVPHTEIQTIPVRIQASPERTEELVSGMDWEALAALLIFADSLMPS
jgi:hypothetical protein